MSKMTLLILIFYLVADENLKLVIFIDYDMIEQQNIKKNIYKWYWENIMHLYWNVS